MNETEIRKSFLKFLNSNLKQAVWKVCR